jgi:hypothetical protein
LASSHAQSCSTMQRTEPMNRAGFLGGYLF